MSKRRGKDLKREETIELIKEGFSNSEIAELLGITKSRVANTKWQYNVANGTVNKGFKSDIVRRWLKPDTVKYPWTRVAGTRGRKGLVLCERNADGTPIGKDPLDEYNEKISNQLKRMKRAALEASKQDAARQAEKWEAELDQEIEEYHNDMINRPSHYVKGGIEVIDFIEAKKLGYNLGNVVKYISRVDDKDDPIENLRKAEWYLKREITTRENQVPMFLRKQAN